MGICKYVSLDSINQRLYVLHIYVLILFAFTAFTLHAFKTVSNWPRLTPSSVSWRLLYKIQASGKDILWRHSILATLRRISFSTLKYLQLHLCAQSEVCFFKHSAQSRQPPVENYVILCDSLCAPNIFVSLKPSLRSYLGTSYFSQTLFLFWVILTQFLMYILGTTWHKLMSFHLDINLMSFLN
jgi:hypothetical protein